jgi:hypothetical protein
MRRKRCKTQVQGNQPDGFAYEYYSSFEMGEFYFKKIIPSPLVVEESGLSRWPWTLEHAGSNPAYQTRRDCY